MTHHPATAYPNPFADLSDDERRRISWAVTDAVISDLRRVLAEHTTRKEEMPTESKGKAQTGKRSEPVQSAA